MLSLVSVELIRTGEFPRASLHIAFVGLLPSVCALMDSEVGRLCIRFPTVLVCAGVGLQNVRILLELMSPGLEVPLLLF